MQSCFHFNQSKYKYYQKNLHAFNSSGNKKSNSSYFDWFGNLYVNIPIGKDIKWNRKSFIIYFVSNAQLYFGWLWRGNIVRREVITKHISNNLHLPTRLWTLVIERNRNKCALTFQLTPILRASRKQCSANITTNRLN